MAGQQRKQAILFIFTVLFGAAVLLLMLTDLWQIQQNGGVINNASSNIAIPCIFIDLSALLSVVLLICKIRGAWIVAGIAIQAVFLPRIVYYVGDFVYLLNHPPQSQGFPDFSSLGRDIDAVFSAFFLVGYVALMLLLVFECKAMKR